MLLGLLVVPMSADLACTLILTNAMPAPTMLYFSQAFLLALRTRVPPLAPCMGQILEFELSGAFHDLCDNQGTG